jgi:hypothetical protein
LTATREAAHPYSPKDLQHGRAAQDAGREELSMAQPQAEKRATRRFSLQLPVSVKKPVGSGAELITRTRDLSARGICFYVDEPLAEGAHLEFTMTLPPEVTLTESIHVRCAGRVVRVQPAKNGSTLVAAMIERYEFLGEH